MANVNKFSFINVSYTNPNDGTDAHGTLFVNGNGKIAFEGDDVEESARVFFENCLKPMCEKYIDLLIEKVRYPLFYWKENI